MKRVYRWGLFLLTALLVSACGGGGGGGSSSSGGAPGSGTPGGGSSASPVALSTANANTAAASASDSVFLVTGTGQQLATVPIGAVVSGGGSFNLVEFLSSQRKTINSAKAGIIATPLGAATTTTVNCGSGGTIGITLDDIDSSGELSTGDTVTMAFNSCNEDGSISNGTVAFSNVVLTESTSTAYTFSALLTVNLAFTDGPDSGTIAGTMTFEERSTDSITITTTLGISSLVATIGSETLTMTDFSTTVTENTNTGAYAILSSGAINSSKLGGTVTISTPATLRGFGSAYPSSGAIKITGANSSVTLTALSSTDVRVTVDSNNDGLVDSTSDTTWAALEEA